MTALDATRSLHDPLALPRVPPLAPATQLWRDRLLAALFVLALAAPGLALIATSDRTTMEFENRAAAPWPSSPRLLAASEFTGGFERAFADRFGARDFLVRLHHIALAVIFRTSPVANVLIGRDGWLYFKGDDGRAFDRDFRRSLPPSAPEIAAIADGITRRIQFLSALGIDYLLVVVPDKYTIHPEHVPLALQPLSDRSPFDGVLAMLPAHALPHVLDLRPALLAAKKDRQLYLSTDTHWNANGVWIGYQQILAALRKDPDGRSAQPLPPERIDGEVSGDLAKMIGVTSHFSSPRISLVREPGNRTCAVSDTGALPVFGAPAQTLYCPSAPFGTTAIFNDSMAFPLVALLADEFRESHWTRARAWNLRELAAWSPAIVIDEVVERHLPSIADVSFLPSTQASNVAVSSGPRNWSHGRPPGAPEIARQTLSCALDQVNATPVSGLFELRARDPFAMEGWAANTQSGSVPQSAWLVLERGDAVLHVPVQLGRPRPDVAAATGKPALATAGYRVVASSDDVPAGTYSVSMVWSDKDGWMTCDLRRKLNMRAE